VPFDVRHADHPLGAVLTLGGELDLATAPLLQEQLERAIRGEGAVVIDLSGLQFIDSSGLNVLVRAERQMRASGRQLVLVYGSPGVRRVFELTSLDGYFASCDSPGAALRTARGRRVGSRRIPKPAADQHAGELERELPGAMSS
jgi:anti-anti-sigma factor